MIKSLSGWIQVLEDEVKMLLKPSKNSHGMLTISTEFATNISLECPVEVSAASSEAKAHHGGQHLPRQHVQPLCRQALKARDLVAMCNIVQHLNDGQAGM